MAIKPKHKADIIILSTINVFYVIYSLWIGINNGFANTLFFIKIAIICGLFTYTIIKFKEGGKNMLKTIVYTPYEIALGVFLLLPIMEFIVKPFLPTTLSTIIQNQFASFMVGLFFDMLFVFIALPTWLIAGGIAKYITRRSH